jgi:hypothetical protein
MGMRERVRFLGGDFSISGGKGRGTTLMVSIPLSGTRQSTGGAFPAGSPAPSDEQPPDGVQESGKEARP